MCEPAYGRKSARIARSAVAAFGVVTLALCVAACAAQDTTIDEHPCPQGGTTLTYDDFGKGFLDAYCQRCHGMPNDQRNGAPDSVRFDDLGDVQHWRDRIFARAAADNTTMPPGPDDPPADQREKLADWLACGAK